MHRSLTPPPCAPTFPPRPARPAAAFTLIELLVVIGIIALLISILLPALTGARDQAKLIACRSNLAQVNLAYRLYANDNKDHYPGDPPGNPPDSNVFGNASYRGGPQYVTAENYYGYGSFAVSALPETMGLPSLFDRLGYLRAPKLWVCPASANWMREVGNSYAWNNSDTVPKWTSKQRGAQANRMTRVAYDNYTAYPFTSGEVKTAASPTFIVPQALRLGLYSHRTGTKKLAINVLYADGRVGMAIANPIIPYNPIDVE